MQFVVNRSMGERDTLSAAMPRVGYDQSGCEVFNFKSPNGTESKAIHGQKGSKSPSGIHLRLLCVGSLAVATRTNRTLTTFGVLLNKRRTVKSSTMRGAKALAS